MSLNLLLLASRLIAESVNPGSFDWSLDFSDPNNSGYLALNTIGV
jgi:hypothetical protein